MFSVGDSMQEGLMDAAHPQYRQLATTWNNFTRYGGKSEVIRGNLFRFDSHLKANLVLGFLHQPSDPDYG